MSEKEAPQPITDLPSGDPVPAAPAPVPSAQAKPFPLKALLAATPSNVDAFLAHVQRCLSTPTGIDTTLLFLCYSSRLSASLLEHLTRPAIQRSARQLLALASALPPSTTILFNHKAFPSPSVALVLALARRLKAFSTLLSDVRTFFRLWGVLGLYFWGRGLALRVRAARRGDLPDGERLDKVATSIAATQLVACVLFQTLENGAYLASKGVLGWRPETIGRASKWSARFWGTHVGLELGRLLYEAHQRGRRPVADKFAGGKTVALVERDEAEWLDTWRKTLVRQAAWFPLTIHWGMDQGWASETTIGLLASIPGVVQMRDLWRRTAE